jgi:hypothetical protein
MNFIGSVLIAEAGEENGFFVFMHMLTTHDMLTMFLPVSNNPTSCAMPRLLMFV